MSLVSIGSDADSMVGSDSMINQAGSSIIKSAHTACIAVLGNVLTDWFPPMQGFIGGGATF